MWELSFCSGYRRAPGKPAGRAQDLVFLIVGVVCMFPCSLVCCLGCLILLWCVGYPILLYGEGAEDVTLKKTTNRLNFQSVVVFTCVQLRKRQYHCPVYIILLALIPFLVYVVVPQSLVTLFSQLFNRVHSCFVFVLTAIIVYL